MPGARRWTRLALGIAGIAAAWALSSCAARPRPAAAPAPAERVEQGSASEGSPPADSLAAGAPPRRARRAPEWSPSSGKVSEAARKVLDSLPDPETVPIPGHVRSSAPEPGPVPAPDRPDSESGAGGCYEVQLTASGDPARAQELAREAARALATSARVVSGGGVHKIRAGGCLTSGQAERLRDRARAQGYAGAFIIPAR